MPCWDPTTPWCTGPLQDCRLAVRGPMRAGPFHHREGPGAGYSGSMAVLALPAHLCQCCPPGQRSPRSQGAHWPPAHPCHLSCSVTPQPVTFTHSEGLCWCAAKPHGHIHPPGIALEPACTSQGKPASAHRPQGTPHTPQPKGCGCARYSQGQAGHLGRGSKGGLEHSYKQGSVLQCSQALGIWDNCPALGCGFAQEKTK